MGKYSIVILGQIAWWRTKGHTLIMVAGLSTSKTHFRDMSMRLEVPEGEWVLMLYGGVKTMSDMFFRFSIPGTFEAHLVEEIFPYAGMFEWDAPANEEIPSYRMRCNMGDT